MPTTPPPPHPRQIEDLPRPLLRKLVRSGGGPRLDHKRHLVAWLRERLGHIPLELWVEADAALPGSLARQILHRFSLRHPWQQRTAAEVLRRDYLAPLLINPYTLDDNVDEVWIDAQTLDDLVRQHTSALGGRFQFWGVHRPQHEPHPETAFSATRHALIVNTSQAPDGLHWVAVFALPARRRWEFFDPQGTEYQSMPCVETMLAQLAQEYGFAPRKWHRPRTPAQRHQHGVTQCGMYSAWFVIVRAWSTLSWFELQTGDAVPDDAMRDLRSQWFRTPTPRLTQVLQERRRELWV